jgi:F0F1-type ATP synthase delta subunit
MTNNPTRAALFQTAQTANACDRIAARLDRMAEAQGCERTAAALSEYASELAHHADALREASGLYDATEANLAALLSNPSTR